MKYNKNSAFEKPLTECPHRCEGCKYFQKGSIYSLCVANDCKTLTVALSDPRRNCIPFNLNCYWWYANSVLNNLSDNKIEEYKEERLHLLTAGKILADISDNKERKKFIKHLFRESGGKIIDFDEYPQYKKVYEEIKLLDEKGGNK